MSVMKSLLLFTLFAAHNEAARILAVFPTPSISHQVVFRPLISELINRGHEIVMLTTDPMYPKGEGPKNLTEIDLHDLSYGTWKEKVMSADVTSGSKNDLYQQVVQVFVTLGNVMEQQMATSEVQALLKGEAGSFDLLLLEAYITPLLGFSHIYKAPVIQVSSFMPLPTNLETLGSPTHPFVYPVAIQQKFVNVTFWEKVWGLYHSYKYEKILTQVDEWNFAKLKKFFGPDLPPVSELRKNVDMMFLNVHPLWESNRPAPPNVVFMGGINQKPKTELPKDLKTYLDSSKHGVIYISFGTNVEPALLPPEKIQALVDSVSDLPYDILWKWNFDDLPGRTKNIKISKWLPQPDLLKHPNVKLFVTQGGLQSSEESILSGVPLLGIPMLGDQWYNVELYRKYGIGEKIDMETISAEKVKTAILKIIKDDSYRKNIIKLRYIIQDQPQTPLEQAAWWTEYVLRHGGAKHLRSPAANMSWTEFYEIELVLTLLAVIFAVIVALSISIYYLYRLVFSRFLVSTKLKRS